MLNNPTAWQIILLIIVSFMLGWLAASGVFKKLVNLDKHVKALYLKGLEAQFYMTVKKSAEERTEMDNFVLIRNLAFIHGALWALGFVNPDDESKIFLQKLKEVLPQNDSK